MAQLILEAPAKLNLTLDVTGFAPNNYHTLDMVMHTVDLCDTVELTDAADISLDCPGWLSAGPDNLAWRAAERLWQAAGVERGAHIVLTKRTPAQAGMGGGSADAAAVLLGLNELWGLGYSPEQLREIGVKLGADVPFALIGGTARVTGIGEQLEPAAVTEPFWFVLAKAEGGVDTGACYRRFDEISAERRPDNGRFAEALRARDIAAMARFGGNVLQPAAVSLQPAVGETLARLAACGGPYTAMTGSGAAVFSVFASEAEARRAHEKLGPIHWSAVVRSK